MNITPKSCVSDLIHYVDDVVQSPSPSVDESDNESLHHQLLEQWFRDRFFLPRPYRSTSIDNDEDDYSQNDIIDDGSCGPSMALFNDSLVSREIRSSIVSRSHDSQESCNLRHRWTLEDRSQSIRRKPPLGVVMVVDTGAPLMPITRDQDNDERMEVASNNSFDDTAKGGCNAGYDCRPTMGFIQRTFSFDEQMPGIHHERTSSTRPMKKEKQDYDHYIDAQPSFNIPVTYSNDGNKRSKVVYPISVPTFLP